MTYSLVFALKITSLCVKFAFDGKEQSMWGQQFFTMVTTTSTNFIEALLLKTIAKSKLLDAARVLHN